MNCDGIGAGVAVVGIALAIASVRIARHILKHFEETQRQARKDLIARNLGGRS